MSDVRQSFRNAIQAEIGVKGFYYGQNPRLVHVLELFFEMDNHVPKFVDSPELCAGAVDPTVVRVVFPSDLAPLPRKAMKHRV